MADNKKLSISSSALTVNDYTADALERVKLVRAAVANLPGGTDLPRLTPHEIGLATKTSPEALEQAAVVAATAPAVGGDLSDPVAFRDAISYVSAYQQLHDEMAEALERIALTIAHRKLGAVKLARPFYHVMKAYAASEAGHLLKPFVKQLQRTLQPFGRRKNAAPSTPPDPETPPKK